ncbi:MAG: DUF4364 family protein [Clostridia bacterium]|nr:DUF4364 family protein [Clostridia bacterium]
MAASSEDSLNKLIILFVFDKMEDSLMEQIVLDICTSSNGWMTYMDCMNTLYKLTSDNFLVKVTTEKDALYSLTTDGRETLANFYVQIPKSLREEISIFMKKNSARYRNKQECRSDYYQNMDGTYTVYLKILSAVQPILELKFVVPDRKTASMIYKKWEDKAADVYSSIYENLVD